MSTNEQNESGATTLIEELNKIFTLYTQELKDWREGKGKGRFLIDEDMFDVVIKLLNVSDKIKKLNVVEGTEEPEQPKAKIGNIQDITLNGKKS